MQFKLSSGKAVFKLIPALSIAVLLLDRLILINNFIIRIASVALVLIAYTFTFLLMISRKPKVKVNRKLSKPDGNENGELGILIPVEDESDLGELLEVADTVPIVETAHIDDDGEDIKPVKDIAYDAPFEILEELQAAEDPVEELEAIDD